MGSLTGVNYRFTFSSTEHPNRYLDSYLQREREIEDRHMFCVCAAEMSHKYSVSLLEPPSQILCRNVTETQFWVPNWQNHTYIQF